MAWEVSGRVALGDTELRTVIGEPCLGRAHVHWRCSTTIQSWLSGGVKVYRLARANERVPPMIFGGATEPPTAAIWA